MAKPIPASIVECYEIDRQLKTNDTAITDDGWVVSYAGDPNIPNSQTTRARKEDKEVILETYKGSEGIALVLIKARRL